MQNGDRSLQTLAVSAAARRGEENAQYTTQIEEGV
jgi:hypothetical protein